MLAALAVAVGLIFALGDRTPVAAPRYHADFAHIGGLQSGARVRLLGIEVRRVTGIAFAPRDALRVDFWIQGRHAPHLHENSEIYIATGTNLLGEPTLEIGPPRSEPGPPLAPGADLRNINP